MQLKSLAESFTIEKLPLLSACYCGKCKKPLKCESVIDEHYAWCSDCEATVRSSLFQVPSWTVGATAVLFMAHFLL
ncbi:hypothetical protein [Aureliella helgolandensis]|uniref:Uncharacterized protein n=1 Tax=Aureliella helgolandensis TaxID=2527968 RepID=A0A518GG25_9BACT|nr:hypothetical protein [Aureliella helgolandensis]QDV27507.1 hypothetical protein Q31a_58960 [Aureliella helgolandensis]